MPRISRSPHRDRGGEGREIRGSDQSSLDQSCCRQNRRCGRPLEEPSSSTSSSGQQEEGRRGGRCQVRRHRDRERREDFRERARREVLVEEAEGNDKPSTRSRVCRWAKIAMGIAIVLGLVFVFYVITTIIIDGSSPLDSLFGQKETVDPNLRNFNSSVNGTFGINEESQTKNSEEPTEVVTFPEPRFTSTIFSATTVSGHELENVKNMNKAGKGGFPKTTNNSSYEGRSFADRPVTIEDEGVDEYYYEDHADNSETKTKTKTNNNKEDNDWDESAIDSSLNHEMIWNDNHQMPDRKNSLSAQIIVNRKGLPPLHRSDDPHSFQQHNLHRSVDLKDNPITTYSRSVQPNPHIDEPSRRNIFLTDYTDSTEDETFNYNGNRRRNENMPSVLSPRNAYSDLERYKVHSTRNQDGNVRFRNRDYAPRYREREYDYQPRDQRYRNRDREAISYQRPSLQRSEFPMPSVSKQYVIRSREPSYSDSYYSPDRDPFPRKELSYGRSLSTPSSTADVKLRKLTELEKSQILEIARLKRQQQLSRSIDADSPSYISHSTPTEYKYPPSATSIRDIIDFMNHRDGKYDSKTRKISNSEEIFRDIRTSPGHGFVIGGQDHVIGKNVFKPFNKFDVNNQNYNHPNNENDFDTHHNNNDRFNVNPKIGNVQGPKNSENNFNNYYKNSNKNGNSYANNNDQRLPLEDAYPSRPRPEQDDHLYSAGTTNTYFNRVNPTVGDPYVGSSSSKSNSDPFSLILDIYPSEDISNDPNAELKTHLSLGDEFRDEYVRMMSVGESRFRSPEPDQNKNEIILHVNLYSKPIRPTHPLRSSSRQEDVALEFPLNGRLSPLDIYRAIVQQKRLSPVASAQTGNHSEQITEQSYFDLIAFDADGESKLYAAIEKGFQGLESYLQESSQENFSDNIPPPGPNKEHK